MKNSISLGELCPDLSKIKVTTTTKIDNHTQALVNTIAHKVEKIGGDIVPVLHELQDLIMSRRDFIVTVGYGVTHLSEVRNNEFFGKVVASRLRLNNHMLYVRANGTIFPITWNNYKSVWNTITRTQTEFIDDKMRRDETPSYMRMFEDAQKDNVTRKKAQSGKRLPRPYETPALTTKETTTITIEIDF